MAATAFHTMFYLKKEFFLNIGGLVGLHPILVAKSLTQECILGADFLVAHGCVLDYTTKTLLAGASSFPCIVRDNACHHVIL